MPTPTPIANAVVGLGPLWNSYAHVCVRARVCVSVCVGGLGVGGAPSNVICTIGRSFVQAKKHTLQCVLERLPEVPIEVRIDERIQRRIEVADPEEHGDQHVRTRTGVTAQRCCHVPDLRGWGGRLITTDNLHSKI